jgi:two-component system chemotaxis sensor kinase CheA
MTQLVVPDELMSRFRANAMERLERIDTAWTALVRGEAASDSEVELLRDVHTLKGDAKVVGLVEASLLCQRLEDLLSAARARGYRVHEDVDIVVTMTIQFISMLVRKRSTAGGGIDLNGFLKQIEEVMSDWLRRSSEAPDRRLSVGPHLRIKDHERVTASSGLRLSTSATSIYLEHLRAGPDAKERIYETWRSLLENVVEAHRAPIAALVYSQLASAKELAAGVGKAITTVVDGEGVIVGPETAVVLNVALVHAIRNAVDHGIEPRAVREQLGKPPVGTLRIHLSRQNDTIELVVQDDGAGIDIERVRAQAVERGLMSAEVAPHAPPEQVLECLFASGFSTRETATDLSGRGIGLDAAHGAIVEHGGTVRLETKRGGGTTMTASVPDVRGTMDVTCFDGAYSGVRLAVPATFGVRRIDHACDIVLEDFLRIPRDRERAATASALRIFGEGVSFHVDAGSKPSTHRVLRRSPTAESELVEIVWLDGAEVVLIRPEVVNDLFTVGRDVRGAT